MHRKYIMQSILAVNLLYGSAWAADTKVLNIKQISLPKIQKPINVSQTLQPAIQPKQDKQSKTKQATLPKYVEGEVIVKYKSNVQKSTIKSLASSQGFQILKTYSKLTKKNPISVLKSTKTTAEMIRILKLDPNVESVSPNYIRYINNTTPNDPDFNQLWGMNNTGQTSGTTDADIDAIEAWDTKTGSSDVVVAVFDTGIDHTHQDLIPNLWVNQNEIPGDGIDNDANGYIDDIYGYDVASDSLGNNDGDPMDVHGHGTHVSGTIGAKGNDGFGVSGVNWDVKIMSLKIFAPYSGAYDSDILEAIDYIHTMKQRGANIVSINASYGGGGGDQSDLMNDAIKGLGDADIVFCAAAGNDYGNDNDTTPHFPSSYDANNIIAVASTDHNDNLSTFSNVGATSVDIAAPGSSILSTMKYKVDYTPQAGDPYFEGIDGTESWIIEGDWFYNYDVFNTGDRSISDGSATGDQYANDDFKYVGQSVDLSSMTDQNLAFGFHAKIDIEPYNDALQLYFYTEETGWKFVTSWYGWDQSMQSYSVEIPEEFRKESFAYALALSTNESITGDGVYIDDIGVGIGTRTNNQYATWSGTSMATPHVAGAVGLMASVHHYENASKRIQRILESTDPLSSLNGKVLTEGRLNLDTAIRYVSQKCPNADQHFDQGTKSCVDGIIVSPGSIDPLPDCKRIQGTNNCTTGDAVPDPEPYPDHPDCELIQGTNTCVAP